MKRSDAFPSNYLAQSDVATPIVATIDHVTMGTLKGDDGEESKPIAFFRGKDLKPLILNNTNWLTLETAYGEDSDDWKNKNVEIYQDPNVMLGKKRVGGIRLRIPHANNQPHGQYQGWTLDQAVAACTAHGITRDEIIAAVKANGHKGWNVLRDTAVVQAMIAAKQVQEQSFDDGQAFDGPDAPPPDDEGIPF
jgi:hypothetical protein